MIVKKFKDGDIVRISRAGFCYPGYTDWVKEYVDNWYLLKEFDYDIVKDSDGENCPYIILYSGPHSEEHPERYLYYIQKYDDDQNAGYGKCYLIGEEGLELFQPSLDHKGVDFYNHLIEQNSLIDFLDELMNLIEKYKNF